MLSISKAYRTASIDLFIAVRLSPNSFVEQSKAENLHVSIELAIKGFRHVTVINNA